MTEIQTARVQTPTQITIHPQNAEQAFFGKDGLTFGDIVDAVNPLNHIPVVSDLMGGASEEKPSVAAKLIGGALLGGPIGFIASLANCIFEQATGHGVAGAVVAALSGETTDAATQLAAAEGTEGMEVAMNDAVPEEVAANIQPSNVVDQTSTRPINLADTHAAMKANDTARYAAIAQQAKAGMMPDISGDKDDERNKAILGLFGGSTSANKAYETAQMRPYLKQANSQVF